VNVSLETLAALENFMASAPVTPDPMPPCPEGDIIPIPGMVVLHGSERGPIVARVVEDGPNPIPKSGDWLMASTLADLRKVPRPKGGYG
jgi:hypothetical protein